MGRSGEGRLEVIGRENGDDMKAVDDGEVDGEEMGGSPHRIDKNLRRLEVLVVSEPTNPPRVNRSGQDATRNTGPAKP